MSLLKRRTVDTSAEEKILTGMIISDAVCRDISKLISKHTIETPYLARAIGWCKEYYDKYKEAPGAHIQDIFEVERQSMEIQDQQLVEALLTKLSEQYESSGINEDFIKDRAIELINARDLQYYSAQTNALASTGRIEEAEKMLQSYKKASMGTSGWEDPLDPQVIRKHFADEEANKNFLFQFPGEIGRFIGPFQRNWLVGILAPSKRGKTFWAAEFAIQAMFAKKRAIIVSLEMDAQRIRRRIYNRLTAMSSETKDYIFPVFDCVKNQEGTCNKAGRVNKLRLLDSGGQKPVYDPEQKYRACSVCRGTKEFIPSTWLTTTRIERMKNKKAMRLLEAQSLQLGYNKEIGSNLRILAYPAFSANLQRMKGDIYRLADEGFIVDGLSIDYPDILAPEDTRITGRERIDQTWKTLKGITDELHCCTFAPSQATRSSFDKKNVTQTDTSEDIRKIANGDLWLAINQTAQEKRSSVSRISKIAARDAAFDQYESVICLQQLAIGQVCLDSHRDQPSKSFENIYEDFSV